MLDIMRRSPNTQQKKNIPISSSIRNVEIKPIMKDTAEKSTNPNWIVLLEITEDKILLDVSRPIQTIVPQIPGISFELEIPRIIIVI